MTSDNVLRMGEAPSEKEINERLKRSLDMLYFHDLFLLKNDVVETAISHKLALYLQQQFDDWHVDCEYNRNYLGDVKRLDGDIVRPDIIIHRRETRADNLMVIEIKKMSRTPADEADGLCKLKKYKERMGYQHAVFLKIGTGSQNCGKYSFKYI